MRKFEMGFGCQLTNETIYFASSHGCRFGTNMVIFESVIDGAFESRFTSLLQLL